MPQWFRAISTHLPIKNAETSTAGYRYMQGVIYPVCAYLLGTSPSTLLYYFMGRWVEIGVNGRRYNNLPSTHTPKRWVEDG